ncbi:FRG domain-containing protein [Hufsiella ginkgonis]|uniref:FRG domain-containing protein n=1 Tax=Hufsiella ginkgonis TaxID=2695274 RepID=A0A7K1Y3A9_9SPHI|nr:FRG domain-containing protein [Hufsiella ginkgonis]MXV17731.1 FRG domain-containing protein [Hufsiella ginkgonis]
MRILEKSSKVEAQLVSSYIDLVKAIAAVSFEHKDYLLFFRGQEKDYVNKNGNSSFYPSIYRTSNENLSKELLSIRFKKLEQASNLLINRLENVQDLDGGIRELKKRKYIRWSILQHYEVCDTPLLDLTQSIRVACSFALMNRSSGGFVYVFALPYITNRISINSEHDIVNIRLLNICPPNALRPYFQEAYLVGTEDVMMNYDERTDLDFKQRLVAKFQLVNTEGEFWGADSSVEKYLYQENDIFKELCDGIKNEIDEQNNIELAFPGRWRNDYTIGDGRTGTEIFEVKNINEYHIGPHHVFNLDSVLIDKQNGIINFRKVGVGNDKRKAYNSLRIVDSNHYIGLEDNSNPISYSRQD